ncbi:redoxin domain-containing protein [Helicobacter saguini]|uniref:Redoxin domain-containing protein n=1 Tax=Helicobacter saguini TaxID=1548018 RepID=A0A347VQ27_9HELI|nr:thioredoxin family protein [Helicobacter saguini]MWV61107.1 redoxin domain-containing protein [Helicobacter saguini]MWV68224.1 redoxin domain-containing protein [Helicobacter saguini]MWV70312.1 redoxin domain-containing protein [Helicobacter saguini]MWV72214.1 redoxin domain-containing protein [Helicobacter saguini]TLD95265.1 thioredoxin [Helicobacter saguini]
MQELNKNNYFDSIKNGIVVVEFQADWCGDCRRIAPIMDKMQKDFEGQVKFFSVNFSNEEELKDTLNIQRIPTLIFYKDGQEIGQRLVEPSNPAVIQNSIKTIL